MLIANVSSSTGWAHFSQSRTSAHPSSSTSQRRVGRALAAAAKWTGSICTRDALVATEVPTSYCGAMPNYYNQRVRSWDFAEHMLTFKFVRLFLKSYIRGSPLRTLVMKAFQTYVLYSIYEIGRAHV